MKRACMKLREVAQRKGYTIKALSEKSGLAYSVVHKYWNDQVMRVDLGTLTTLARVLECRETELIQDSQD